MDKKIKEFLDMEQKRQNNNIELIASENFTSKAVLDLQGSILTNKYAEGYSGKRYYGGCEFIDKIETYGIELACELFGCKYANIQSHSGSSANMAVYRALLNPGDKVMGMDLSNGGHLTHGHKMSFSGQDYDIVSYSVDKNTGFIDFDEVLKIALEEKPKLIIAGASAYSREIDFKKFREIADKSNSLLMVDMAHIAGLVATNLHINPIEYADVVTSTTHKTLRGPRGGIILTNSEDIINKINKTVFPGIQGGPLMHVIAAKAQCFSEALNENFKEYMINVVDNAKTMSEEFIKNDCIIVSGGTDNHMFLLDVYKSFNITGKEAEETLDKINITVNKNTVPNDVQKPFVGSGIRIGTAAMTTKEFDKDDFIKIANIIIIACKNINNEKILSDLKSEVLDLTKRINNN